MSSVLPLSIAEEETTMSDLGIFSLLVIGRDLPPAFIPTSGADYRPVDRTVPIAQQREAFPATIPETTAERTDATARARVRLVS
jgi:hypothetical protein